MSKVDIILLIPIAWGAFMGFRKGLVLELASLVGLVLGIYGAIKFSDFTAEKLVQHVEITQEWLGLLSFLITFIIIVFAVFILARLLDKALKLVALGTVNRLLGLLFGALKFAIIVSTAMYFFQNINAKFQFTEESFTQESVLWSPLQQVVSPFKELLQDFEISTVEEKANEITNDLKEKAREIELDD